VRTDGAANAARTAEAAPAWKPALQVILVPLAILAVLWLVNVRLMDPPYFQGTADQMSKDTWTWLCFAVLVVVVGADAALLRGPSPAPWAREDRGEGQRVYLIGCKTCGTVFERPESQLSSARTFRCPNCARMGRLAARSAGPLVVAEVLCPACGLGYRRYREGAECPHCHVRSA
jgi:predicted Zn-ribbon and HTH transcriptional regulator